MTIDRTELALVRLADLFAAEAKALLDAGYGRRPSLVRWSRPSPTVVP